jgi:hypothetical protein
MMNIKKMIIGSITCLVITVSLATSSFCYQGGYTKPGNVKHHGQGYTKPGNQSYGEKIEIKLYELVRKHVITNHQKNIIKNALTSGRKNGLSEMSILKKLVKNKTITRYQLTKIYNSIN